MSKILITGGTGFVGSNLVDFLTDIEKIDPRNLRLLIPPWESLENLNLKKFEIIVGDIRDKKIVAKSMKGVDVVYHLAAKTIVPGADYGYYRDVNIDGTKNLIEAAINNSIKKFIYFSSISVFGLPAWRGDMLDYSEETPKKSSEPYGKTKLE